MVLFSSAALFNPWKHNVQTRFFPYKYMIPERIDQLIDEGAPGE
jgi:hypothetical protein